MKGFFSKGDELFYAAAPGRMDIMGGIADYSGSLLLQMAIKQLTKVALKKRKDKVFRIQSVHSGNESREFNFTYDIPLTKSLRLAGELLRKHPGGDWGAYVLGCFILLEREKGLKVTGADILVESDLPVGKGVSSSAALEVATLQAIAKAWGLRFSEKEIPVLAQRVENQIVGAACGLMDQLSVYFSEKNRLLPLICQPHTVLDPVEIPAGIQFAGIDSGIRHAVGGAAYGDVRTAAFMGYSVIAQREGVAKKELRQALKSGDWSTLPFGGYLANIAVSVFEQRYASLIPEKLSGRDFIRAYGVSIDQVTDVDPDKIYKPLVCSRHPVYEEQRVNLFMHLMKNYQASGDQKKSLGLMGELMYQSHASYSTVGLGHTHTDELVDMVRRAGNDAGVFGARVSGGGSGGTVVVLSKGQSGRRTVRNIYETYKNKYRQNLFLFTGSNHGSLTLNR